MWIKGSSTIINRLVATDGTGIDFESTTKHTEGILICLFAAMCKCNDSRFMEIVRSSQIIECKYQLQEPRMT